MSLYDEILSRDKEAHQRLQDSFNSRDEKSKFAHYFKSGLQHELWKQETGAHVLDIIPWLAGKNYPHQPENSYQHVLILWVHQRIGYAKNNYVCLQMNYDKPCPICEKINEMTQTDGYDEDFVYSIEPKRRCVYYVLVWDSNADIRKGVQIWEAPHWYSEKHISAIAKQSRTGAMINFAHPQQGKTIEFIQTKTARGYDVGGWKLTDRIGDDGNIYEIEREIFEGLEPLDNLLDIKSYEELDKITIGAAKPKEKDDEKNAKSDEPAKGRSMRGRGRPGGNRRVAGNNAVDGSSDGNNNNSDGVQSRGHSTGRAGRFSDGTTGRGRPGSSNASKEEAPIRQLAKRAVREPDSVDTYDDDIPF